MLADGARGYAADLILFVYCRDYFLHSARRQVTPPSSATYHARTSTTAATYRSMYS